MRTLSNGLLLAIEGIDGAGKTTQTRAIAERLTAVGLEVVISKEPTGGPWGQKIRAWAVDGRQSVREELDAFMADRAEHVQQLIKPALDRGAVVILDRYYYSNAAYQGSTGASDPAEIIAQNEAFAPRPDLLVVIDVPVDVGLMRIEKRGDLANAFETAPALEACRRVFRSLSGPHVLFVDGLKSADEVTAEICLSLYLGPIFRALCMKPHLRACEPEYCSFRDSCGYGDVGLLAPVKAPHGLDALENIAHDDKLSPIEKVAAVRALIGGSVTAP